MDLKSTSLHLCRNGHGHGGLSCRCRHLGAVGIPADGGGVQILAADLCLKGIGAAHHSLAAAADLYRCCGKHCRHVQILLKAGVGAGLFGDAVAPLYKDIAAFRHSGHRHRLGGIGDLVAQGGLAADRIGAQGAAAVLVHPVACLVQHRRFLRRGRGRGDLRAAGCCHGGAGVSGVLRTGGDVGSVGTTVLGVVGVGPQIAQQDLESGRLQVDVPALIIVGIAVAVAVLQRLGGVQELQPHLLTHGKQRHVEVVDLGLVHVGVVGVLRRHRGHRVDDDIRVGIAGLDRLHKGRIVGDKICHLHAGIVGAQHDHHPAGLHFCHCLSDGVAVVVPLEGHDTLVEGSMGADALLGAKLLQRDKTVGVETHRVGVADEQGLGLVLFSGVCRGCQQSGRGLVDLIMIRDIVLSLHLGGAVRDLHRTGDALAPADKGHSNADGQQQRKGTHKAYQHCLLLHGRQRLLFRLCILFHFFHLILLWGYVAPLLYPSSWSARSWQLLAYSTGWKGSSSSLLP